MQIIVAQPELAVNATEACNEDKSPVKWSWRNLNDKSLLFFKIRKIIEKFGKKCQIIKSEVPDILGIFMNFFRIFIEFFNKKFINFIY